MNRGEKEKSLTFLKGVIGDIGNGIVIIFSISKIGRGMQKFGTDRLDSVTVTLPYKLKYYTAYK